MLNIKMLKLQSILCVSLTLLNLVFAQVNLSPAQIAFNAECGLPVLDAANLCVGDNLVSLVEPVDTLTCDFRIETTNPKTASKPNPRVLYFEPFRQLIVNDQKISYVQSRHLNKDSSSTQKNLNDGVLTTLLGETTYYIQYGGDLSTFAGLLWTTDPAGFKGKGYSYGPFKLQAGYLCENGTPTAVILPPSGCKSKISPSFSLLQV